MKTQFQQKANKIQFYYLPNSLNKLKTKKRNKFKTKFNCS